MEQILQKQERVIQLTEHYLNRFGKVMIGIYYLPPLDDNFKFGIFINSLLVILRRLDLMPEYYWFLESSGGHYLILFVSGYFRNDLSEITPVICRLWGIQNSNRITVIDSISISTENPEYGKERLRQFLYSHGLSQTITTNWHQRTFGCSRLT